MALKHLRQILMRQEFVQTIYEDQLPETPQFVKDTIAAANKRYAREARKLNAANERELARQAAENGKA